MKSVLVNTHEKLIYMKLIGKKFNNIIFLRLGNKLYVKEDKIVNLKLGIRKKEINTSSYSCEIIITLGFTVFFIINTKIINYKQTNL